MKIGVGIVNQGDIKFHTMLSLVPAMVNCLDIADITFIGQEGALVPWAREDIFKIALDQGSSHLLFCDTDMKFPGDTIKKLVALKKDVVGVWSFKRKLPKEPTVHVREESPENYIWRNATLDERPTQAFCRMAGRSVAVGTGLMLIDLEKAKRLDVPRFRADYGGPGEDLYFCSQAIKAGLEVWCDPTIQVGHIGDFEY